jgi:hypothetical protein
MDNESLQVPILFDQSSIILPLSEEAFRDFIVSLLGQPETMEGFIKGSFEIDFGKFQQLNDLIDNRISSQNISSFIEFKSKLFLSNDLSLSFNSIQSFLEYKELRPLICEGFTFTWSYLVKFNDKQSAEKQEISVFSSRSKNISKSFWLDLYESLKSDYLPEEDEYPTINYYVRSTNKSWGIEICQLIDQCLRTFKTLHASRYSEFRLLIIYFSIPIRLLILGVYNALFYVLKYYPATFQFQTPCLSLVAESDKYIETGIPIERKVNYLIQTISACNQNSVPPSVPQVATVFLFSFIISVLTFHLIYELIRFPSSHFLIFTEESKKIRNKYFSKLSEKNLFC